MKNNDPIRFLRTALRRGLERSRISLDPALSRFRPGKAALLHVGRSGSTVLGSMLGQHRRVFWDGEAIVQPLVEGWEQVGVESVRSLLQDRGKRAGARFHLISVKFYHFDRHGLDSQSGIRLLEELGFTHFIVLRRRNLLRKLVSSLIASRTGRYHRQTGDAAPQPTPVRIDPSRVEIDGCNKPLLQHLDSWSRSFEETQVALADRLHLTLSFEDHIEQDPGVAYRRSCEFLEIPAAQPEIVFQPTNPFPLPELITNFEEVATHLDHTPHAWMLTA